VVWTRLCDVDATVAWRARPKGQLPQSVQCTIFVVTRRSTACQNYRGHVPLVGLAQRAHFSACDNRSFVRSSSKRTLQLFTDDHAPRCLWGYAGFGSFDVDTPINCARLRFRLKMWDPGTMEQSSRVREPRRKTHHPTEPLEQPAHALSLSLFPDTKTLNHVFGHHSSRMVLETC
jgi:hypothetical protein